jgi:hypothetical protein
VILGISVGDHVPFLNLLGLGFLGVIAAFGVWFGRRSGSNDLEVAGALVDSKSVDRLTAAIEGQTLELIAQRHDAEKARQARYRGNEITGKLVDEIEELRRVLVDATRACSSALADPPVPLDDPLSGV